MHHAGHIEVRQVYVPTGVQKHVGWFHITMYNLVISKIVQSQAELRYVKSDASHRKSALFLQMIADVPTYGNITIVSYYTHVYIMPKAHTCYTVGLT